MGVSVSELVRIKFIRITNHIRGSRYPNSDKSYKSSDTEVPWYQNRGGAMGVSVPELVGIEFVWIANNLRGVSVSEQFGYRDPSVM